MWKTNRSNGGRSLAGETRRLLGGECIARTLVLSSNDYLLLSALSFTVHLGRSLEFSPSDVRLPLSSIVSGLVERLGRPLRCCVFLVYRP